MRALKADERRRDIIMCLYQRRSDTMPNLAAEFHVSVRTIQRDIEYLSQTHPIYTVSGHNGGIMMAPGFRMDRKYFTPRQLALLQRLKVGLPREELEVMNEILATFALHP